MDSSRKATDYGKSLLSLLSVWKGSMRRRSLILLASVMVMITVVTILMFYLTLRLTTSGDTAESMPVDPATLPSPQTQQSVEPDGVFERLVFILSVLFVFVSALLVLARLLGKVPFKD